MLRCWSVYIKLNFHEDKKKKKCFASSYSKKFKPSVDQIDQRDIDSINIRTVTASCWGMSRLKRNKETGGGPCPIRGSVCEAELSLPHTLSNTFSHCSTYTGCEVKPSQTSQPKVSHQSCGISQSQTAGTQSFYKYCSQSETDTLTDRRPAQVCTPRSAIMGACCFDRKDKKLGKLSFWKKVSLLKFHAVQGCLRTLSPELLQKVFLFHFLLNICYCYQSFSVQSGFLGRTLNVFHSSGR